MPDPFTNNEIDRVTVPAGVTGQPQAWLRLEAIAAFALGTAIYAMSGRPWWLFVALFLAPDVSFLGYLLGPRVGAFCYNATHSYVLPVALGAIIHAAGGSIAYPAIWVAHIGFDRVLGYGLKYDAGFGFTHLGRLDGRRGTAIRPSHG